MTLRFFCLSLLLAGPALAAEGASFQRVGEQVSQGRFAEAAADLEEIAIRAGRSPQPPAPGEEKLLRDVIEKARTALKANANRKAARQVLCMSRAWFPEEELAGEDPLRVGGAVRPPKLIGRVEPRYTEIAARARVTGTVILETIIDQEGCSRRPRVLKGLPMGLDAAALAAVRNWTFEPATLKGRPMTVYYLVTLSFPSRRGGA